MNKIKYPLGNRDATIIFLKNIEGVFFIKMSNIMTYSMKERLRLNIQKKDLCNKSSTIIKLILEETIEEFLKQIFIEGIKEFALPEYQEKYINQHLGKEKKEENKNYYIKFIPAKDNNNPMQYLGYRTNRNPIIIDLIIEESNIYTTEEYLEYSSMDCKYIYNGKYPKLRLKIYDISFLERIKIYFKELAYKCSLLYTWLWMAMDGKK